MWKLASSKTKSKPQRNLSGTFCLVLIAVSQLVWILPGTRLVLFPRTSYGMTRDLFVQQFFRVGEVVHRRAETEDRSTSTGDTRLAVEEIPVAQSLVSAQIDSEGFSAPVQILTNGDVKSLSNVLQSWEELKLSLDDYLMQSGYNKVSSKTCFIWLPECYKLAKHSGILKVVKAAIGDGVLLYGMTLWQDDRRSTLQQLHLDVEMQRCAKVINVVVGGGLRVVQGSHKMDFRLAHNVMRQLISLQAEKATDNETELQAFVERGVISRLSNRLNRSNVELKVIEAGPRDILLFHGRAVYSLSNHGPQPAVLMQFASDDCRIREPPISPSTFHIMLNTAVLPPTLQVLGNGMDQVFNDVRESLAVKEVFPKTEGEANNEGDGMPLAFLLEGSRISACNFSSPVGEWRKEEGLEVHRCRAAPILSRVSVQFIMSHRESPHAHPLYQEIPEDQLVIVLEGSLFYHQAPPHIPGFKQVTELGIASATHITSRLPHALVPTSLHALFVSVRWTAKSDMRSANLTDKDSETSTLPQARCTPTNGLKIVERHTVLLKSGQAYDPSNENTSDVVIVVVRGSSLQLLPLQVTIQKFDIVFVPAGEPCVLWNSGKVPVTFVVLHLHGLNHSANKGLSVDAVESCAGSSGKIMRRSF